MEEMTNKKSVIGIKKEMHGTKIIFVIKEAGIIVLKKDNRIRKLPQNAA